MLKTALLNSTPLSPLSPSTITVLRWHRKTPSTARTSSGSASPQPLSARGRGPRDPAPGRRVIELQMLPIKERVNIGWSLIGQS